MMFLGHFGRNEPVGKSDNISPRMMHIATPAGMSETAGKMHIVKLAS